MFMYHFTNDQINNLFIRVIISERGLERARIKDPNFSDSVNFANLLQHEGIVEEYEDILHILDLEDIYQEWKEEHTYLP